MVGTIIEETGQLAYVAFQLTTTVSALDPLFAFLS